MAHVIEGAELGGTVQLRERAGDDRPVRCSS